MSRCRRDLAFGTRHCHSHRRAAPQARTGQQRALPPWYFRRRGEAERDQERAAQREAASHLVRSLLEHNSGCRRSHALLQGPAAEGRRFLGEIRVHQGVGEDGDEEKEEAGARHPGRGTAVGIGRKAVGIGRVGRIVEGKQAGRGVLLLLPAQVAQRNLLQPVPLVSRPQAAKEDRRHDRVRRGCIDGKFFAVVQGWDRANGG